MEAPPPPPPPPPQGIELQTEAERQPPPKIEDCPVWNHPKDDVGNGVRISGPKTRGWWIRVAIYVAFVITAQSAAILLGRLYFDKGGNSKWMSTLAQSIGFPVLIPVLLYLGSSGGGPKRYSPLLFGIYAAFGFLLTGDNMMYTYGLLYLPVSTYSLLCATQLAFNAVFAYFLNAQRFTPYILNSLVLLTVSATLLAFHSDSGSTASLRLHFAVGFLLTVMASATYSLYLSLVQVSFEKIVRKPTFSAVLDMQFYPSLFAACGSTVGLLASGEWRGIGKEMAEFQLGKVPYLMTLIWIGVCWQLASIGLLGLVFEVGSLFSNVISTMALPVVPILAVMVFHDKMDGIKAMAMIIAIWGFISYIYQHYLDDAEEKAARSHGCHGNSPADACTKEEC
ncbi:hypothetical protein MLD38_015498 [Melastoma candidum]|uniref:Uncharacterized protein n=1 Tax=Melastoma candidum TaxID=119954 RepID=A0ACB9RHH0_9MYRT|nr:hypothetical protein MLD38_015498 [Melastoma candidum]